jgi:hypothetical protein
VKIQPQGVVTPGKQTNNKHIDTFIVDFQEKKIYKRLLLYGDPTFINVG